MSSTIYFGYGSNLWLEQMRLRCPSSPFIGIGRLSSFRWIINSRGYANIVPSSGTKHEVYGVVYKLTRADEAALDKNEGVPNSYTKETMAVDFWKSSEGAEEISRDQWEKADVKMSGQTTSVLVYIDRLRTEDGTPKDEYVHRMNMGIADALAVGIPARYVEEQLRPFIPKSASKEVERVANEQAKSFVDGR